jgi:GntR family transcriptional regulator, histidine utilization repressor
MSLVISPPPEAQYAPYARVKQHLKNGLAEGRWPPGALMPSEAELVSRFHVSRMTVNRALRELQAEGLVSRSQGVGTFAAPRHVVASQLSIRDLHDEIAARGAVHRAELRYVREERATAGVAGQLGLKSGARVFHSLIVHRADGVPLQIEDRYVNPACAPGYLAVDFDRTTPTRYLLDVAPLWEAEVHIEARGATAEEAELLAIDCGAACLVLVRRTHRLGTPITLARLVHPGSRYTLQGSFKP